MRSPLNQLVCLFLFLFAATACVSVKLSADAQKSKKVFFSSPGINFDEIESRPADRAWKSRRTGNTVSFFSDCTPATVTLARIQQDFLASLPSSKVLSEKTIEFDGREALDSTIDGKLEGIPMRVGLLVYQKNGCRYSLSYIGRATSFDLEAADFQRFKSGFSAP